jgi:hypothetical protein
MDSEPTPLQKRRDFWIKSLPGYTLDIDTGATWRFSKNGAWFISMQRSTLEPNEILVITYLAPEEPFEGPWLHNAYIEFKYGGGNEEPPALKAIIKALNDPDKYLPLCLGLSSSMDELIGFYMKLMNPYEDFELKKKKYQEYLRNEQCRSELDLNNPTKTLPVLNESEIS